MRLEVSGTLIEWRGPAPFVFLPVPEDGVDALAAIAREVTYGWGAVPARVRIGATEYTTSLFPRDGGYLVPVKVAVQRAERIGLGDAVRAVLLIGEG